MDDAAQKFLDRKSELHLDEYVNLFIDDNIKDYSILPKENLLYRLHVLADAYESVIRFGNYKDSYLKLVEEENAKLKKTVGQRKSVSRWGFYCAW